MTLSRKIAAALDENTRSYNPPCLVAVDAGTDRIALEITALDSVGVAFDGLEYQATDRDDRSPDALNAWGEALARRVRYLMEPLKVLEVDAGEGVVQLRSEVPSVREDVRNFYEVRLGRRGTCRIERYAFDPATRARTRTSCFMTREMLERLADDIAATSAC